MATNLVEQPAGPAAGTSTGAVEVAAAAHIRGMRERVQHSGGTMEVSSMRGRGFEVRVRLPL